MSKSTFVDELIDYKENVLLALSSSQKVIGLLANKPDIDLESDEARDIMERNFFDYDYVSGKVQRSDAYVMVETVMSFPVSGMMNRWLVYVQVVSAKTFNQLDHKIFKGVKGNRRDNLVREIDLLLNGSRAFGVGRLDLRNIDSAIVPDEFTSTMLTYEVMDFRNERLMRR